MVFGGDRGFYWRLTGRENLEYWAALYKVPPGVSKRRAAELLERFGLSDRADYLVETYSRGMRQRLHLARALIANAPLLFLDEPTTAMDPIASHDFRELVKDLKTEGRTIILTTHDMAEAESVCDRVTLIDHGHILAVETPRSLGTLIAKYERIDFEGSPDGLIQRLRELPGVASVSEMPGAGHRVELSDEMATGRVLETLVKSGGPQSGPPAQASRRSTYTSWEAAGSKCDRE